MELRNIHFAADFDEPETEQAPAPVRTAAPAPASETRLHLRTVKVSPHQEYALRDGQVAPISDALASLICSRKGRAEIGPKGIVIERKDIGGKRTYHHVDSRLCNDLSQRERKFFYVLNSLKPDIVHILSDTGIYLESLPEKKQPGVLNTAEQKTEYDNQRLQVSRLARHMQELHGEETAEAIAALTHNASVMKGIVQVLGTETPSPTNAPAPSRLGDQIANASRDHEAGLTTYDRSAPAPAPQGRCTTPETASQILARRAGIEVECPY